MKEEGFIDTFILVIYFLFFLLILGMGIGIGASVLRMANAEYGWFSEAMDCATRAANINGEANMDLIISNQNKARQYLISSLDRMMPGAYTLDSFQSVDTGTSVPVSHMGMVTTKGSGYWAKITVKINAVMVPFLGKQDISIPMTYFAILKSVN
jgi:hypothetical protein